MDWVEKMKVAMLRVQEACQTNDKWSNCQNCPFDEYCTVLLEHGFGEPSEWEIEIESKHQLTLSPGQKNSKNLLTNLF